ncbi:PilN domain-containing protein [Janthinobacterium sp. HLX7-2]|uniref:PilN domain-containing protein n=1 Tax=Janthinobacterium sp. HLX7-2 TaxID=1259331 RepID=UPI003F241810
MQLLLWQLAGGALLGLLLALGAAAWLQARLDAYARRQDGWRSAMQQVDVALATGKRVHGETAALLARQQAIAGLQEQRNAWVRMLEALARAMPAGVVLHSVRQEAAMVRLQGHAVSQDKVAALLLALADAAPWSRPELLEVRGVADGAVEWTIRLAWPGSAASAA